ncbi:group III truncated hemoglobin [Mucilaginibacter sp. dw_454]|uniref:group III truncated hemoglobin n=1 Tax=Mucilaginibacter sp. dw_454 TaxID=2720079 RepID=UPI001BD59DC8|nr:group III truncated hemoglobin [Mucilaginibacter sp. dw_454]
MPAEILTLDDIKLLVDTFYGRIQNNDLLAPIFNQRIENNWPQHLEKMYRFWQTVLLDEYTYLGSPFPPHAKLPVEHKHFETWLALFNQTVDELFTGLKAEEAKWRAAKMAQMFEAKIAHVRNNPLNIL